jgi:hypothetical protein
MEYLSFHIFMLISIIPEAESGIQDYWISVFTRMTEKRDSSLRSE